MEGGLFLVFLDFDGLQIFGLENLTAIQAFDVFHACAAGNHLGTGMVANGLHKQRLDEVYFNRPRDVVKPPWGDFCVRAIDHSRGKLQFKIYAVSDPSPPPSSPPRSHSRAGARTPPPSRAIHPPFVRLSRR